MKRTLSTAITLGLMTAVATTLATGFAAAGPCDTRAVIQHTDPAPGEDIYVRVFVERSQVIEWIALSIDGATIRTESRAPYEWGRPGQSSDSQLRNLSSGTHELEATIRDTCGASHTIRKTLYVTGNGAGNGGGNGQPSQQQCQVQASFAQPDSQQSFVAGDDVYVRLDVQGENDVERVALFVDQQFVRTENTAPYEWGRPNGGGDSRLRSMTAGTHHLRAVIEDECGDHHELSTMVIVEDDAPPTPVEPTSGPLTMTVTKLGGGTVAGADVCVGPSIQNCPGSGEHEQSDSQGRAEFDDIPFGSIELVVVKDGYQRVTSPIYFHGPNNTHEVELRPPTEGPLTVRVKRQGGSYLVGADVCVGSNVQTCPGDGMHLVAGGLGRAEFDSVPYGPLTIMATMDGFESRSVPHTFTGPNADRVVELQYLPSGTLTVQVKKPGGGNVNGAEVCFGIPTNDCFGGPVTTSGSGLATKQDLPYGPVMLTITHPGYRAEDTSVNYSSGTPTQRVSLTPNEGIPPVILAMDVNGPATRTDSATVQVNWSTTRPFTAYRLSQDADFSGAAWEEVTQRTGGSFFRTLEDPVAGQTYAVHLQVRGPAGAVSAPRSASIQYGEAPVDDIQTPQTTKSFTINDWREIRDFILVARGRGFRFTTRSNLLANCEPIDFQRFHLNYLLSPPGSSCHYEFFKGRNLAPGWTLDWVVFEKDCDNRPDPGACRSATSAMTVVQPKPGADPEFTMTQRMNTNVFAVDLKELRFTGPADATSAEQALER